MSTANRIAQSLNQIKRLVLTILRHAACFLTNEGLVFCGLCKAPMALKSDDCIIEH